MINYNSILSSFNERGTLLKWLKTIEKALNNGLLTRVDVETIDENSIKLKFVFADNTEIVTEPFAIPSEPLKIEDIEQFLTGSEHIIVEQNEDGTKIVIELDNNFVENLATNDDIEQIESELETKQHTLVDSEEIVIDNDNNKLMLQNAISNKINRALLTPTASQRDPHLVGVDSTNSQQMYAIGDGLTIDGNTLKATGGSGGSGGTQLYQHFFNGNSPLYIINTSSQQINRDNTSIVRAIIRSIASRVERGGVDFTSVIAQETISGSGETLKTYYFNGTNYVEFDVLNGLAVNDVVTPL